MFAKEKVMLLVGCAVLVCGVSAQEAKPAEKDAAAKAAPAAAAATENLFKDPSFEGEKFEAKINSWQRKHADGSAGKIEIDKTKGNKSASSVKLTNTENGSIYAIFKANPGEVYAITADCFKQGDGSPSIVARWRSAAGKWLPSNLDRKVQITDNDGKWNTATLQVTVPQEAAFLSVFFAVDGQKTDKDIVWFDNISFVKVK